MDTVVACDIRDDHRRAEVAEQLAAVRVRPQMTMFECIVDADTLSAHRGELEAVLDLHADVLHVFGQCADCCETPHDFGPVDLSLDAPLRVV